MRLGVYDIHVDKPLIVTGEEHRFLVYEQLREVGVELGAALLEPVGRNTARHLRWLRFLHKQVAKIPYW